VSWQRGAQLLGTPRLRAFAAAAFAALVIVSIQPPAPASAASPADRVVAIAMAERGRPWVYGATGPSAFDCVGLVIFAFGRAHELGAIGNGHYQSGTAMLRWARLHHLTTSHGQRGDVAVWGNGSHVGIYLGNGRVVSTLVNGVRVTGTRALTTRFTTFIRTGLSGPMPRVHVATKIAAKAAAHPRIVARRTVATSSANMRSAPRISSAVYRVLSRGTRVGVVRTAKDAAGRTWYQVVVGSRSGWVAGWLTRPAH
jgi:cell wall-associated NlpC family hydrolase